MTQSSNPNRCALCHAELPRGLRVAFFRSPESDECVLGDFCCVTHAFEALELDAQHSDVPETIFLGVRIDRMEHDESALSDIMAEIARRAVRAALDDDAGPGARRVPMSSGLWN